MSEEQNNGLETQQDNPDAQNSSYREMVADGLRSMSDAANLLNSGVEIRKISEGMFYHVLLPIVRSWVADKVKRADGKFGEHQDLGKWLTVAGGPNREIDVIDQQGELIFRLPPPFMDVAAPTGKPVGRIVTVGHLIDHQEALARNGEAREVIKINDQLVDLLSPKPEDVQKTDYILTMALIWDRYDLPLEEVVGPELAPSIKKSLAQMKSGKGSANTKAAEIKDDGPAEYDW